MKIQSTITIVEGTVVEVAEDKEAASEDPVAATGEVTDLTPREAAGSTEMTSTKKIMTTASPTLSPSLPSKEKDTTRRRIWP